jgi:CHAT domain
MAHIVPLTSKRYDYRPDIQLRIMEGRQTERYQLEIIHDDMYRVQLDIGKSDVARLAETLQKRLKNVAEAAMERLDTSEDELRVPLELLAKAGHAAFTRLLGGGQIFKKLVDLERKRANARPLIIQITSPGFAFPWDLLYSELLGSGPTFQQFWGFQFVVSRIICRPKNDVSRLNNEIECFPRPQVGVVLDLSLENVAKKEFPYFRQLNADKRVDLFKLETLSPGSRRAGIRKFKSFFDRRLDVAHFACHGSSSGETEGLQEIRVDEGFRITLEDLEADEISFNGYPLVVMNNCESGNINPQYTFHFADYFLNSGEARGLVATECEVPDQFAAAFSRHLYNNLLKHRPLGDSILQARQYFLRRYSNPLGLTYSVYAPPSIRFATRREKPKEVLVG